MVGGAVHHLIVIVVTAVAEDVEYPGDPNIVVCTPLHALGYALCYIIWCRQYDRNFCACSVSHWITLFCFMARP